MGSQSNGELFLRHGLYILADSSNIYTLTQCFLPVTTYVFMYSYMNSKISTRGWGGRAWSLAIHVWSEAHI